MKPRLLAWAGWLAGLAGWLASCPCAQRRPSLGPHWEALHRHSIESAAWLHSGTGCGRRRWPCSQAEARAWVATCTEQTPPTYPSGRGVEATPPLPHSTGQEAPPSAGHRPRAPTHCRQLRPNLPLTHECVEYRGTLPQVTSSSSRPAQLGKWPHRRAKELKLAWSAYVSSGFLAAAVEGNPGLDNWCRCCHMRRRCTRGVGRCRMND